MSTLDQKAFVVTLGLLVREEADRYGNDGAHPTPEELAAYHSGELSEGKDEEIQIHLAACSECPDLLIDLEDLFEPRHRDLDLSDTWISGAWRDLRAKLGDVQESKGPFWRRWMRWFSAIPRPAYALSTGLMFFLLVGGTAQISSLRHELARPVGELAGVRISPESRTRSAEEAPPTHFQEVRFAAGVNKLRLGLRLIQTDERDYRKIQANFYKGEKTLWSIPVSRDEDGLAYVEISRWTLEPGQYEIRLIGSHTKGHDTEEVYPIQIVHL
jgi:hypothetical protein